MEISFKPHPNEFILDVQCVLINDELAGYCGTVPDRPITLIKAYSDEIAEVISEAVKAEVGEVKSVNRPPKPEDLAEVEGLEDEFSDEE